MIVTQKVNFSVNDFKVSDQEISLNHIPKSSAIISVSNCISSNPKVTDSFRHSANIRYIEYRNASTGAVSGVEFYLFSKFTHRNWQKVETPFTKGFETPLYLNIDLIVENLKKVIDFNPTKLRGFSHCYQMEFNDIHEHIDGITDSQLCYAGTRHVWSSPESFISPLGILGIHERYIDILDQGSLSEAVPVVFSCKGQLLN